MVQVLLTNEEFIKGLCNIDENIAGKYLKSALIEAQEIGLKEILGDALLDVLKGKIQDKSLDGMYKELVEKCQYALAYKTIASLCIMATYKIANVGTVTTSDDNVHNLSWTDLTRVREYYVEKSDMYTYMLQNYLLDNKSSFPELSECDCNRIKACLYSAASSGLWLGGVRAYKLRPCRR